jgi:hypothetical protein
VLGGPHHSPGRVTAELHRAEVELEDRCWVAPTITSSTSKMKFINIFLCLWFIFALLDPDMNLDPDPQH